MQKPRGGAALDLRGQRFGRWEAIHRTQQLKKTTWICRCECGAVRAVSTGDLRAGKSTSCGCLRAVNGRSSLTRQHQKEHNTWAGMKQRCYYPLHIEFARYGGRGITVCDEWRHSFAAFLRDMGPRPEGCSIERTDNDKPYCKDNCTWATRKEQAANTSRNVRVEFQGRSWTLKQLAEHLGLDYYRLQSFYRRRGRPIEEAVAKASTEKRPRRGKPQYPWQQLLGGVPNQAPAVGELRRISRW